MQTIQLIPEGQEKPLALCIDATHPENLIFEWDNQRFEVAIQGDTTQGTLVSQGQVFPFYVARTTDAIQLWMKGKTYKFKIEETSGRRSSKGHASPTSGDLKAPMPGTVLKIPVKVGDSVEANQAVLIMESMKMEMTLTAPQAGVVEKIHCQEGQLVDMGSLLVQLKGEASDS